MSQSAPHERVAHVCKPVEGEIEIVGPANFPQPSEYVWKGQDVRIVFSDEQPADWPDEDGPVTDLERWALRQMRAVPHGQVTFWKQDGDIVRVERRTTEKPNT